MAGPPRERRSELESEHGDAFTLLAMFDQWIQVKARRQESTRSAHNTITASRQAHTLLPACPIFRACAPVHFARLAASRVTVQFCGH